jgi:hypothetical protein
MKSGPGKNCGRNADSRILASVTSSQSFLHTTSELAVRNLVVFGTFNGVGAWRRIARELPRPPYGSKPQTLHGRELAGDIAVYWFSILQANPDLVH